MASIVKPEAGRPAFFVRARQAVRQLLTCLVGSNPVRPQKTIPTGYYLRTIGSESVFNLEYFLDGFTSGAIHLTMKVQSCVGIRNP